MEYPVSLAMVCFATVASFHEPEAPLSSSVHNFQKSVLASSFLPLSILHRRRLGIWTNLKNFISLVYSVIQVGTRRLQRPLHGEPVYVIRFLPFTCSRSLELLKLSHALTRHIPKPWQLKKCLEARDTVPVVDSFRLLDAHEVQKLAIKLSSRVVKVGAPDWTCTHCSVYYDAYATLPRVVGHLKTM